MNNIILVVLPDGSVHRATLIEPGLGAPVYKLGKLAGSKERKPRTKNVKAPTPAAINGGPGSASPIQRVANESVRL